MNASPGFDLQAAHRHFSAQCFNRAWDYIDKPRRTAEEERTMLQLGLASLWHWSQRQDCTPVNLSVGYWQVARIYALLGQAEPARQYGQLSLDAASGEGAAPFHLGYAYEALARAESVAGDRARAGEYLAAARRYAAEVSDAEDQQLLLADLASLE